MAASISTTLIRTVGSLANLANASRNCLSSLPCNLKVDANRRCHLLCTLRLFEGWLSLLRPGPPPKLLRNKEYEALRQAYGVDMLLLDPKLLFNLHSLLYLLLFFTVKWGYVLSGGGDGNDGVRATRLSRRDSTVQVWLPTTVNHYFDGATVSYCSRET
ncbi:hypothetical protein F2Q68_00021612 [Brassica cretica]|uniref:Uncharacterized protein n=1 Tax=Brassica cretica TaxID=69181 RepID=A0A8S9FY02_BRACR|nr:hypothetical protein F2Q68_00021612 [Brassica cretica]